MIGFIYGLFCCVCLAELCSSSAIIEIRLVRFNTSGLLSTKLCCDSASPTWCPADQCDPQFFFCLQDYSGNGCLEGNVTTGYVTDQDAILFSDVIGNTGTTNPLVIHVDNYPVLVLHHAMVWADDVVHQTEPLATCPSVRSYTTVANIVPGIVIVKVTVYDEDRHEGGTGREKMDYLQYVYTFQPDTNGTQHAANKVPLRGSTSELDIEISVHCDENYYGNKCDVTCIPDDRHYCDNDGTLLCKPGLDCSGVLRTLSTRSQTSTTKLTTAVTPKPTTPTSTAPTSSPQSMTQSTLTLQQLVSATHIPITSTASSTITHSSSTIVNNASGPSSTSANTTPASIMEISTRLTNKPQGQTTKSTTTTTGNTMSSAGPMALFTTPNQNEVTITNPRNTPVASTTGNQSNATVTGSTVSQNGRPDPTNTTAPSYRCFYNVTSTSNVNASFYTDSADEDLTDQLVLFINEYLVTKMGLRNNTFNVRVGENQTKDGIRRINIAIEDTGGRSSTNTSDLVRIIRDFCYRATAQPYKIAKGDDSDTFTILVPTVVGGLIVLLTIPVVYFLCRRKCKKRQTNPVTSNTTDVQNVPLKQ